MANSKAYEITVANGTSVDILIGGNSEDGIYEVTVWGMPNVSAFEFSHQSSSTSGIPSDLLRPFWSLKWDNSPLYVNNASGSSQTVYVQYTRVTPSAPSYS